MNSYCKVKSSIIYISKLLLDTLIETWIIAIEG